MYSELKKLGLDIECAKPVSDEEIQYFEKELEVQFGNEYKAFLKEFGCLSVGYLEFYGICGKNTSVPSAIHATKSTRINIKDFPKNLIVFFENGDGSFLCLDSDDNVLSCQYSKCTKINQTFKEFLFEKIKGLL